MKNFFLIPLLTAGFLALSSCSHYKGKEAKKQEAEASAATVMPVTQENVTAMIESWPEHSKQAVNSMHAKYGLPAVVADEFIVWNNTAPFKRTTVYRDGATHLFPLEHTDVIEQVVDYRIPVATISKLSLFDGSMVVDRTRGELSYTSDKEEMNILAFNLANKIIKGQMGVEEARREFVKDAEGFASGTSSSLISQLNISPQEKTADPDLTMQSQTEGPKAKKTEEAKKLDEKIEEY